MSFRYHVGRQTLYANFQYSRARLVPGSSTWEQVDEVEVVEIVFLHCVFQGVELPIFEVGKNWPLTHMTQELRIALGNEAPRDFSFEVMEQGVPNRKVNARNEGKVLAGDVLPLKLLLVVEHP
jgi:hypothetical protein